MFTRAANPDECRVILDMFLAKAGIPLVPVTADVPYPSPTSVSPMTSRSRTELTLEDAALEHSLVDMFLGGSDIPLAAFNLSQEPPEDSEAVPSSSQRSTPVDIS